MQHPSQSLGDRNLLVFRGTGIEDQYFCRNHHKQSDSCITKH
ncbi:UNVERIFIED_CONTAM: hypothetical protein NCL1_14503 [Trichonephila clavipes]